MITLVNLHADARTPAGLARAVAIVGCESAALEAVLQVEAGSHGFDHQGRLTALFEPHIFCRLLSQARPDQLAAAQSAGLAYVNWGAQPYPPDSYPRIEAACQIEEELALQATSWGLPQILGENFMTAGYASAGAMVSAFLQSEDEQLMAMAQFIVANDLADALKRLDWAAFAKGYNGPGYARSGYEGKLAAAYVRLAASPSAAPAAGVIAGSPKTAGTKKGGGVIVAGSVGTAGAWRHFNGGPIETALAIFAISFAILCLIAFLASLAKSRAAAPASASRPTPAPAQPPSAASGSELDAALTVLAARKVALAEAVAAVEMQRALLQHRIEAQQAALIVAEARIVEISAPAPPSANEPAAQPAQQGA